MTSQLNVDTIVDKTGSGGTNIKVGNTATYVSDGGNVTQNTVQSLVKFWMQADLSSMSYDDSFNASSATDTATGEMTSAFTNNFSNASYSITGASNSGDANVYNGAQATNQWRTNMRSEANASTDASFGGYMIAGDLA